MSAPEQALLAAFLDGVGGYVEFGVGGSTCFAAARVHGPLLGLDSSQEWLDQVAAECAKNPRWVQPKLSHVDIGPLGAWGYPADESRKADWAAYSERIWDDSLAAKADLFLVDGRFRVACVLQTFARCRPEAVVLVHDYDSKRAAYRVVERFGRRVAMAGTLAAFVRRGDYDADAAFKQMAHVRELPM